MTVNLEAETIVGIANKFDALEAELAACRAKSEERKAALAEIEAIAMNQPFVDRSEQLYKIWKIASRKALDEP